MIWPMIRSSRDHFFKKDFLNLTVLTTIIANSEKMKMKKSYLSMTFSFPLPSPFWSPTQIFYKIATPTQFFGNSSPFQKRGVELGEGRELYVFI